MMPDPSIAAIVAIELFSGSNANDDANSGAMLPSFQRLRSENYRFCAHGSSSGFQVASRRMRYASLPDFHVKGALPLFFWR